MQRTRPALALAAALGTAVVVAVSAVPALAAGGPGLGQPCPKQGMMTGLGPGKSAVCARTKGKLVWTQLKGQGPKGKAPAATTGAAPAAGGSSASSSCDPAGVKFTASIMDPASVASVTPIGGQTGSGGVVAVRSYVSPLRSLAGQRVPIMAPVDMTLTGAAHYKLPQAPASYQPEYSLYFTAPCSLEVKFFHVKALADRLAAAVPAAVAPSSAGNPVPSPVAVKAGEVIGYWIGGNESVAFDFWVDNPRVTNAFITPARYGRSNYLHAVCPYAFYAEPLRSTWLGKLASQGGTVVAGTPCGTVSQGKLGTALGQWFLIKDPAQGQTDVITYDGSYMSQGVISFEADKTVRIGGFWSPGYVIIGTDDPSWADPSSITTGSSHCWFDRSGNRSVSVVLDSATQMRVAVADGPCPASVAPSAWKTYYR